jgi:hypothetical protein
LEPPRVSIPGVTSETEDIPRYDDKARKLKLGTDVGKKKPIISVVSMHFGSASASTAMLQPTSSGRVPRGSEAIRLFVIARNSSFKYKGSAVDLSKSGANSECATARQARLVRTRRTVAAQAHHPRVRRGASEGHALTAVGRRYKNTIRLLHGFLWKRTNFEIPNEINAVKRSPSPMRITAPHSGEERLI